MHRSHFPPRLDGSIGEFDVAGPARMQRDHPCVSLRTAKFKDSKVRITSPSPRYRTHVMDAGVEESTGTCIGDLRSLQLQWFGCITGVQLSLNGLD